MEKDIIDEIDLFYRAPSTNDFTGNEEIPDNSEAINHAKAALDSKVYKF